MSRPPLQQQIDRLEIEMRMRMSQQQAEIDALTASVAAVTTNLQAAVTNITAEVAALGNVPNQPTSFFPSGFARPWCAKPEGKKVGLILRP